MRGSMIVLMAAALMLVAATAPEHVANPIPVAAREFVVGQDSLEGVIAKLGKPSYSQQLSDGTRVVSYAVVRTRTKGASYVPLVGLFASGTRSSYSIRTFTFGADGKLVSFTISEGNTNCSGGIQGVTCH